MKTLYVVARNHMDPSWRRCFTDHFDCPEVGGAVRPYSDIEEAQILEYMDFAEKYGVRYQIEQSITVKRFLERNPDARERFEALLKKGLFELAGGGEAVIDYNMTSGESWARDHLYNIRYYRKEFGHKAKYAICPDTFGLPAQLPQFMRSLGYDAIIVHDRVFQNNKPYWKGLDGTLIVLDPKIRENPDRLCADCFKLLPCKACGGNGCEVCGGTGIDRTHTMSLRDKGEDEICFYGKDTPEEMLEKFRKGDKETYFISVSTEETEIGGELFGRLLEAAPRYDFKVEFLTYEENFERWLPGKVEALRAGKVPPEEIDERVEGNPMATGCYTSRIEMKKQNKQLEELLLACERIAVLAYLAGGWRKDALPRRDYPRKKFETLWNRMAFIQFHDCITSSHGDASYTELMRICREVRLGASQIYADAVGELLRGKKITVPAGYRAAVYFNPDTAAASYARLTLHWQEKGKKSVEVTDGEGNVLNGFDLSVTPTESGTCASVTVPAAVPALGWRVFFYRLTENEASVPEAVQADTIENEYLSVKAENNRIVSVYDKKNGRPACGDGAFGLSLSRDCGHPWGRLQPEADYILLCASETSVEITPFYQRMILKGGYTDPAREAERLLWKQTLTLRRGEPFVRLTTELDWQGQNNHVYLNFPLPFASMGTLQCEVPFGRVGRGAITPTNLLGEEDEWPSLGYAGAGDGKRNLAVFKEGLPGTRLRDNVLQISLLRSPFFPDMGYHTNTDCGKHTSECALYSFDGDFADGNCAALSASFNAAPRTFCPILTEGEELAKSAALLPRFADVSENLRLSALKLAEDDNTVVLRLWEAEGKKAVFTAPAGYKLVLCNTLEEPTGRKKRAHTFRPFEIATFRIVKAGKV